MPALLAFSTVACPHWTLDRVAEFAGRSGFGAVELRTTGFGPTDFACDPAATAPDKTRRLFADAGVGVAALATSIRFDAPVRPRVLGHAVGDQERDLRRCARLVDLAAQIECPVVRVFGFEARHGEPRLSLDRRVADRLARAADHADKTGVRLALENGGSYSTAADLAGLIDRVGSPLLGAAYSIATAAAAGDDPVEGVGRLGHRLLLARVKDLRGGRPVPIGSGELPCAAFAETAAGLPGCQALVVEWDRAWFQNLPPAEEVLPEAARFLAGVVAPRPAPAAR